MKKIATSLLFITVISFLGFSQPTFDWVHNYSTTGNDYGYGIDVDATGNTYWCGHNSNSNLDFVFEKIDPSGNSLWTRIISGSLDEDSYDLKIDNDGNIVFTGYFSNTVDFDPGPGVVNLTSSSSDSFVAKYDPNGNLIWAKKIGNGTPANSYSVKIDNNNNIIIGGVFHGTIDLDPGVPTANFSSNGSTDVFIVKLDQNGSYVWGKSYGNSDVDYYYDLSVDENGSIYIATAFKGTEDFDPGTGVNNQTAIGASYDGAVLKLSSSGTFSWVKLVSTTANDRVFDIECNQNGKVYYTGYFVLDTDFNPNAGSDVRSTNGGYDIYIVELTTNGDFNWVSTFGGTGSENRSKIHISQSGEILVGGYFENDTDLNPTMVEEIYSAVDGRDIFLVSYNTSGNYNYGCVIGGIAVQDLRNISSSSTGEIYVVGMHNGTTDFNPGTGTESVTPSNFDAFVLKLNPCQSTGITPTQASLSSINNECEVNSLSAPTATTSCGLVVNGTHNASLPITTQGTTVVTWTYDDGNGNTTTQTQNVVIDDVTAPVADVATLSDVTSECSVTSLTAPTATDNCAGSVTGTHNASLPITGQGTTVVTWTYDDGNGNTSTQTQNVLIDDITAPVVDVATLSNITSECSVTSLTAPTATDNCVGSVTGTHNVSLPITTQGTTVVTWTYDDGNGNARTQNQNIVIDDITAPIADVATLSNITSECEITSLTAPTATDNCVGSVTGTHNVTLPISASGTITITWTYDDGNGNTSTQTQNVIITPINNGVTQVDAVTLSADATGYNYQWIDCNNGNQAINGATSQTYVATTNGSYAVEIDNGTCMVTSNCMVINQVGISEIGDTDRVEVYPNPTTGMIHISSLVPFNKVEVMNALGQKVGTNNISETEKYSLTLPEQNGVYFVKVYFDTTTLIKKIIKQ